MTLTSDLRQAIRSLSRQKRFAAVVLLTLGTAIGANAAVFHVVNLTLLRPLPFEEAERLFRIQASVRRPSGASALVAVSQQTFAGVRDLGVFERTVGQRLDNAVLRTNAGEAERVIAISVTAGWTDVLGVRPMLGRGFTPEEERLGAGAPAVLLGHAVWQRLYGGDPPILGRAIALDDRSVTVVGVMPPGFSYPYHAELWLPMTVDPNAATPTNLNVVARLRAAGTLDDARARLGTLGAELARENPQANGGRSLAATPLRTDLVGDDYRLLVALLAAVACVLLIAAANVSSLLLTRAVGRRREMAVRAALGATRGQRFRTVLCESLLLAGLGGALGSLMSTWAAPAASALLPDDFQELGVQAAVDGRLVAFTLGATAVAALIFGVLPAFRLSSTGPINELGAGMRTTSSPSDRRLLGGVVIAEIAMTMLLLVGAVQMLAYLRRVETADPGFRAAAALSLHVPLSDTRLRSPDARLAFLRRVLDELRGIPGVESVGLTSLLPVGGGNQVALVSIEGHALDEAARLSVNHRAVDTDYFEAMGIPQFAGRRFDDRDRVGGEPVAIVSRALADRFWPGENPLGKRIKRGRAGDAVPWLTVVGVVGNVHEPRDASPETWYLPYTQQVATFTGFLQPTFVVRSAGDLSELARNARAAVRRVDGAAPVFQVATLQELLDTSNAQVRLGTGVMTLFAVAGVLLVLLGVYGVTTHGVAQRMQEIGIRMTFGAAGPQIVWMILRQATTLAIAGLVAGTIGAVVMSRGLERLVPGIPAVHPAMYAPPLAALAALTLLSAAVPAWRATRVDPLVALRDR